MRYAEIIEILEGTTKIEDIIIPGICWLR